MSAIYYINIKNLSYLIDNALTYVYILSILFPPFCRSKAQNLSYFTWEISILYVNWFS